jgi:hypothetical protein
MKRSLLSALMAATVLCSTAIAAPAVILRVPVELDNLPAEVTQGQLECNASSGATYDPTRIIATGLGQFAVEGGRYSGRVSVAFTPTGYPAGVDSTVDVRSYSCALVLKFRCTASAGETGWCASAPGGGASPRAPAASAAMFASDPARPPTGTIQGVIDRSTATTLPTFR